MRATRFLVLLIVIAASALVATEGRALCVKCVVNECWGSGPDRTAANCYSYGTACLTSGHCESGGDDEGEPFNRGAAPCRTQPGTDYVLASVRIDQPKKPAPIIASLEIAAVRR